MLSLPCYLGFPVLGAEREARTSPCWPAHTSGDLAFVDVVWFLGSSFLRTILRALELSVQGWSTSQEMLGAHPCLQSPSLVLPFPTC